MKKTYKCIDCDCNLDIDNRFKSKSGNGLLCFVCFDDEKEMLAQELEWLLEEYDLEDRFKDSFQFDYEDSPSLDTSFHDHEMNVD